MPQYSYPGVYVQEVQGGPAPISGTSPSTCAFVGFTLEGKINEPVLVQSLTEFKRKFGGFTALSKVPTGVNLFFTNGGQQARIVRVVASDASKSSGELLENITNEALTPDTAPNAVLKNIVFTNDILTGLPVAKGSSTVEGLKVIEGGAGATITFEDVSGNGVLVGKLTASGALVANTSGTVDYETGEITLTYDSAPVATITYSANYNRVNIRNVMSWEGATGNDFRISIEGDSNYENRATASFSRYILNVDRKNSEGAFETQETFDNLVISDSSSDRFISTVVNDENSGSDFVRISGFADTANPSALNGSSVSSEALTFSPALDGLESQFAFDLANSASQSSFSGTFNLAYKEVLGSIAGAVNSITNVTGGMSAVAKDILDTNGIVVAKLNLELTGLGAIEVSLQGDGSGTVSGQHIDAGTTCQVTINADAGTYTITSNNGDTVKANAEIALTYVRKNPITLVDDGAGVLEIASSSAGDNDIILDINGTNSIVYGERASTNATVNVKFKLTSNPSQGPVDIAGDVAVATYHKQASKASILSALAGGSNGSSIARSNISSATLVADSKGLYALNKIDDLLQIVIPDFETSSLVSQDLVDYCSTRKDRFALISVPQGFDYQDAIDYKRSTINRNTSSFSAIYYPHLKIIDPVTEREVLFPPSSVVAGIYARVDQNRNVSKAPAGTVDGSVRGATGVEFELSPSEVGSTNLAHVNNIVNYPYTGLCVWGGRTMQVGLDFPYIQMRRLFMFVEKTVFNGTQGFVFESNTASLRFQIKAQIESFLLGLFNSGHFAGESPASSFFVVCDSSNNTEATIAKGLLFIDVGLAPTKPAEFIVFRFQQKTGE
jgi:phage tail sheath protein FI